MQRACLIVAVFSLLSCSAVAQDKAVRPEFEVATVRLSTSGDRAANIEGSQFSVRGATLSELLQLAYSIREDAIIGSPSWFASDHFDVVAKKPTDASRETVALMVQSLLASEFKLELHYTQVPQDVFALSVAKGGPHLQKATGAAPPECTYSFKDQIHLRCTGTTVGDLLTNLRNRVSSALLDRPLVDVTGITGSYDVALDWTPPRFDANTGHPADEEGGITIFVALTKQLGLQLEERRIPQRAIVIDHAERLREN